MKLRYTPALLAVFALAHGGCTSNLWQSVPRRTPTYTDIGTDRLLTLRVTRQAGGGIPAGTLILVGEKNWYIADKASNDRLVKYLTAGLSTPFYPIGENPVIIINDAAKNSFVTLFRLAYRPSTADLALLKRMGNVEPGEHGEYLLERLISGTYYPAPTQLPAADSTLPINRTLHLQLEGYKTNLPGLAAAVIATPVTLAADAVSLITIAPLVKILPKPAY